MGFKYVFIPASTNDSIQELEFPENVDNIEKDLFRESLEKYYSSLGESIDREVLLGQLKARTGVDLSEKLGSGEVSDEQVDKLMHSASVEIFPVQLPTRETNFQAVSVYCDDKGVAKELEENPRMSGLVQACGFPAQTFRGDCFVGRIYDDTEDVWKRIDFTLKDCSSDAPWVIQNKRARESRNINDMSSMASKLGVNQPVKITPESLEDTSAKGETDEYKWVQNSDEVEITFKAEGLQKGDKKLVKVVSARQRLKVEIRGETYFDHALHGPTDVDVNTWTLSDGVLQVTLAKASDESWPQLLAK